MTAPAGMRERPLNFGDGWARTDAGLYLPPATTPMRRGRPIGVCLFAGAGGFDLGFTMAGYHMAAAVEFERDAAATYLTNLGGPDTVVHGPDGVIPNGEAPWGTGWIAAPGHPACTVDHDSLGEGRQCPACSWRAVDCACAVCVAAWPCEHFWLDDIRNVRGADILAALQLERGGIDVVIGGPPCQGFSIAGKRDVMDPRNSLVFEYARLIRELWPKTFVMENVTGILNMITPEGVPVIDAFCRQVTQDGYGEYQALRRALLAQAGAVVGTPHQPKKALPAADADKDLDEDEQLDLFAGAPS